MRLRPTDIHEQSFRVTFRGFDPVEVDGFLKRVADELERLIDEKNNLELELDVERASKKSLEDALESTGRIQMEIIDKAREEARLIQRQAKLEADLAAEAARDEIRGLQRELGALRDKRIALLSEVSALAHGLADWVKRYESAQTTDSRGGSVPEMLSRVDDDYPMREESGEPGPILMDMVSDSDSYRPSAERKGPEAGDIDEAEELESIEILEEIPRDDESGKK